MKNTTFAVLAGLLSMNLFATVDDGLIASRGDFPAVVKVTRYKHRGMIFGAAASCTGTLISPTIVLTAAHCLEAAGSITRVSISGDEKGTTSHTPISGRGIRVKALHMPTMYPKLQDLLSAMQRVLNSSEFRARPQAEQINFIRNFLTTNIQSSATDLAFIELETAQPIRPEEISQLACDVIEKSAPVTIAGYGMNVSTGGTEDQNDYGFLYYGHNQVGQNQNVYFIPRLPGFQMVNKGDSGGPLYKRDMLDKVYGVVSSQHKVGDLDGALFASTGSVFAHAFYKEILESSTASARLKSIVRRCLPTK